MAPARRWALLGGLGLAAAEAADEDAGWELLVTSSGPEVPRTCLEAQGLPEWLSGAFIISGPALFERGDSRFESFFDGFGRANRFELRNKQVCYTSKWLATGAAKAANASNSLGRGLFFMDTIPPRPPCPFGHLMCDLNAPNDNNWVNLMAMGDQGVMLSDTHKMLDLDLESLTVTGVHPWADDNEPKDPAKSMPKWVRPMHVSMVGSAHPLQRPGTTTVVDVVAEAPIMMGSVTHYYTDVFTFDNSVGARQPRRQIASIKTDNNHYIHSFGVTPNYIVLPFNIGLNMPRIFSNDPQLMRNFLSDWKGIYILDHSGTVLSTFADATPFYHAHIVNAFENGTGVVLDVGATDEVPFRPGPALVTDLFLNKTARDSVQMRQEVRRFHFHMSGQLKGRTTVERFENPGRAVDFFKINMALSGRPYCIYYAVEWWHDGKTYADMAIMKHDICKGQRTYWSRPNTYPGEPFFVASEGAAAEDDGVLLVSATDGAAGKNVFVVLDAQTMKEVESVQLPVHIPFTAHGQFLPDRRAERLIV